MFANIPKPLITAFKIVLTITVIASIACMIVVLLISDLAGSLFGYNKSLYKELFAGVLSVIVGIFGLIFILNTGIRRHYIGYAFLAAYFIILFKFNFVQLIFQLFK